MGHSVLFPYVSSQSEKEICPRYNVASRMKYPRVFTFLYCIDSSELSTDALAGSTSAYLHNRGRGSRGSWSRGCSRIRVAVRGFMSRLFEIRCQLPLASL